MKVFYNLEPDRSVFFLNTCPQLVGKSRISHCQVVSTALGIHWAIPCTANNIKNTSTGLKKTLQNQLPSPQGASKSSLFLGLGEVSKAAVQYHSPLSSNAGLKSHYSPPPRVLFLTWMISVIPFTAQPHSCNRTEEQQLGCEDRNRWLGLRRKRLGISQAAPSHSSGLSTRAESRLCNRHSRFQCFFHMTKTYSSLAISLQVPKSQDSLSPTALHPLDFQPRAQRGTRSSVPVLQVQQFYCLT